MNDAVSSSTTPNQDERIMAALSHVTAILPFLGVIAPIVIWVTQKDKSQYVAFQALQALGYQLTMILAWFVGMACYMCSFFGTFLGMIPLTATSPEEPNPLAVAGFTLTFLIPFIVFGAIFVGGILFVIYGLVGAVMVLQGKDFRYLIIGTRLERYLQQ
jgi:uncharacterized Tic20 family protein